MQSNPLRGRRESPSCQCEREFERLEKASRKSSKEAKIEEIGCRRKEWSHGQNPIFLPET